jgi:WD40 repeat protein
MKSFILLSLALLTVSGQLISSSSATSQGDVLARSFDGRLMVVRLNENLEKAVLQEVRTKKILRSFAASESITSAAFSRAGDKLVIAEGAHDDIVLRIWNTKSGRLKRVIYEPRYTSGRDHPDNWSVDLAFTLDGETLINGTYYGIRVWDWKKKKLKRYIPLSFLNYMTLSQDGKIIRCSGTWIEGEKDKHEVRVFDTRHWKRVR